MSHGRHSHLALSIQCRFKLTITYFFWLSSESWNDPKMPFALSTMEYKNVFTCTSSPFSASPSAVRNRLINYMPFWELAPSSMAHTLGCPLALLDVFFVCNTTAYACDVERESFGSLLQVVLAIEMLYL